LSSITLATLRRAQYALLWNAAKRKSVPHFVCVGDSYQYAIPKVLYLVSNKKRNMGEVILAVWLGYYFRLSGDEMKCGYLLQVKNR